MIDYRCAYLIHDILVYCHSNLPYFTHPCFLMYTQVWAPLGRSMLEDAYPGYHLRSKFEHELNEG